jgi:hypothetical protein
MNRLLAAATLMLLPVTAWAQAPVVGPASCEAERAVYEMSAPDTDAIWRIGLVPARTTASIASDLYLKLTTPQRDYWFTFSVAQGYGSISVFPITDPNRADGPRDLIGPPFGANPDGATDSDILGALRFLSLDAELNVAFVPPMRGEEAPPYIMLPEIGQALWYNAAALSDDPTADRDPMPRGVFKRTQCRVAPHREANP